jgi:hypothetical protein
MVSVSHPPKLLLVGLCKSYGLRGVQTSYPEKLQGSNTKEMAENKLNLQRLQRKRSELLFVVG